MKAPRRIKYVRVIKGQYWYFRTKATGDVRLPGNPLDAGFWKEYARLLKEREHVRTSKNARSKAPKPSGNRVPRSILDESTVRTPEQVLKERETIRDIERRFIANLRKGLD